MRFHLFLKNVDLSDFGAVSIAKLFSHILELFVHCGYLLHEFFVLLLLFVVCLLVLLAFVI